MATAKAYGSITIVDIGDLGTLSVYPESNHPNSVIYDPNTGGGTYNPNWASSNLILTPVIYYGGTQIELTDSNLTVTWKRKIGSGEVLDISSTDGETKQNNNKLKVEENLLTDSNPIRTYICEVVYKEPRSQQPLSAKGQISFSLISQPTTIKSCSISGESVFLYGSDQQIKGSSTITLHGQATNCEIENWAYKVIGDNGAENWVVITDKNGSTYTDEDLVINASDSAYFNSDIASIRLMTNADGVYDIHTITNIRDGAAGESVLNVTLSNEDMYVPCDKNGTPTATALDNAKTEITVYEGNNDISNSPLLTIDVSPSSGTVGEWEVAKKNDNSTNTHPTYKVTAISTETATVTFKITYIVDEKTQTTKIVTKTLYLTKLKAGQDGVTPTVYEVKVSTLALNKTATTHVYTPSTFTASAKQTNGTVSSDYEGRFKIYSVAANGTQTAIYTSDNNESTPKYAIEPTQGTAYTSFIVELYKAGGTTQKLDSQTITVISDGDKGDTGASAVSFDFGNPTDVVPCTNDGKVTSTYQTSIPFAAYQGTARVACNATITAGLISGGIAQGTITSATTTANGNIPLTFTSGSNLNGADSGTITITLTTTGLVNNTSTTKTYTWTKNKQAAAGSDAVLVRTYAPNGNVINNGENDVKLSCTLTKGTTTVTSGASYKWSLFNPTNSSYTEITASTPGEYTGYNTQNLIVPADAVDSYASYMVTVTYNSKTYVDYITVQDKTDPLQVEVFSTLGDKITNGVGIGCVYARVYQNGEELDDFKNLVVSDTAPTAPSTGDVWAHIDASASKVNLKAWTGTKWESYTPSEWDCTYTWTFGDYDGKSTHLNNVYESSSKFLYVTGALINKKMQFNLTVTKN